MATDVKNTSEDAEMADCEEEKFVTMMDVLQEQEDIEEDANAVLGASDDKNCTYSKGYIRRQALYACLTCCSEAKEDPDKRAGVCLACSLTCHENHELVELYTKRNFKCDCGNPKFNSHPCQFTPNKTELNESNIYNQNFSGLYCICHRPYPDPESTVEEVMIQCIICEDWLHASHLEATVPANYLYSEMICKACMKKNDFLHDYTNIAVNSENIIVDVVTVNGIDNDKKTICNGDSKLDEIDNRMSSEEILKANVDNEMTEEAKSNVFTSEENALTDETCSNKITEMNHKCDENVSDNEMTEEAKSNVFTSEENALTDETCSNKITEMNHKCDENVSDTQEVHSKEIHKNEECSENVIETESEVHKLDSDSTKVDTLTACEGVSFKCFETENTIDSNKIDEKITEDIVKDDQILKSSVLDSNITNEKVFDSELVNKEDCAGSKESITNEEDNNMSITENETEPAITERESTITESIPITENKETVPEIEPQAVNSTLEPEGKENDEKSEEQIGEDKLLADSEDNTKNVADDANEMNKDKSNVDSSEPHQLQTDRNCDSKSTIESNANTNTENNLAINDELQKHEINTDVNIESKTTNEDAIIDQTDENIIEKGTSCGTDETIPSVEAEMKDNLLESSISNKTEPVPLQIRTEELKLSTNVEPNENNQVETELNNSDKISEKRKLSSEESTSTDAKKPKLDETNSTSCLRPKHTKKVHNGATFWPSNFRQKLCTCRECISMYKDLAVLFLIDPEDTATAYENLGKQKINGKPASQYEKGLQALSSLDRVQQINALTEYNKMRDKLLDFLKSFKDRKEIVKEEDIKAFFAGMKPKREPDGVYFCR